jgi:hypothetical protein
MNRGCIAWLFTFAAVVSLHGIRLVAHPGASSDIVIERGRGNTVDVLLTTHPESLLLKLQALGDTHTAPKSMSSQSGSTTDRISAHRSVLVTNIVVRTHNRRVDLDWIGIETPDDGQDQRAGKVVVRMRGMVSHDEERITVQTGLIFGSYPLIVRHGQNADVIIWMNGAAVSPPISLAQAPAESTIGVAMSGVLLGFSHIVPRGLDHVLFILGLFLLAPGIRALLVQVSVFTLAHTVTLAATTLGVLAPPTSLVEPLIALSIVFIALENVVSTNISRWRLGLVFVFGLLHGMGFAGVLTSMSLPQSGVITTLVSFNVGVELAQIAILVAAAAIVRMASLEPRVYRRLVVKPASLAIAAVGVVWVVERVWLTGAG